MNCIIVDDDINCIHALTGLLRDFAPKMNILGTARTISDAVKLINSNPIDIVFLDIEIQQESGFDLFRFIPHHSFEVVFTTAHEQYAVKAIRSSCFDYLLKPIVAQELVSTINRLENRPSKSADSSQRASVLIENLSNENKQVGKLALPVKDEIVFVNVVDIVCLEGDAKYTTLHLLNGDKKVSSRNIGEFEELLDSSIFFRCHRSWIVNLKTVTKFLKSDNQILLSNQMLVDVSTRRKDEFLKLFSKI
jgi:two-component system, LytTR family, response regulator